MIVISAWVGSTALKWPLKTALFPLVISISLFLMTTAELLLSLFGKEEVAKKGVAIDFKFSEDIDKKVVLRRTITIFSWVVGFFFLINLFGFPIAVALFVFLYLKIKGREKWGISIIMTFASWFFFWGLFIWLLNTPMMEGWIFEWLRAVGIG
jgi:hypothetical protein